MHESSFVPRIWSCCNLKQALITAVLAQPPSLVRRFHPERLQPYTARVLWIPRTHYVSTRLPTLVLGDIPSADKRRGHCTPEVPCFNEVEVIGSPPQTPYPRIFL